VLLRRARDMRWFARQLGSSDPRELSTVDHVDSRSQLLLLRLSPDLQPLDMPAVLPADPEAADQDANMTVLSDGGLVACSFTWYPVSARVGRALEERGAGLLGDAETTGSRFLYWGGNVRRSADGGRSWTGPDYLPPVPGSPDIVPGLRPNHGGAIRGRGAVLPDGTLLQASYAHIEGRPLSSHLFASGDGGRSWTYRGVIASDAKARISFVEPCLLATAGGRLIAFHRTFGLDDHLASAVSEDGGFSWRPWRKEKVIGHPHDVLALPDGRALVVYGYRHAPYGIRARIYDPDRENLGDVPEYVLREDGHGPDLGYPWATLIDAGTVLVVYYFVDGEGIRHVAGTRVRLD